MTASSYSINGHCFREVSSGGWQCQNCDRFYDTDPPECEGPLFSVEVTPAEGTILPSKLKRYKHEGCYLCGWRMAPGDLICDPCKAFAAKYPL